MSAAPSRPPSDLRLAWDLLERRERRIALLLIPAFTVSAILQAAGIASVLPFLSLVADPTIIDRSRLLHRLYELLGFTSHASFLVFTGTAALVVLLLTNGMNALADWFMLRFSWRLNHVLSERLLEQYLAKPYAYFLDHNSSTLVKNMLAEVRQAVTGWLLPWMQLVARTCVVVFILALLVVAHPLLALTVLTMMTAVYLAIFLSVRRRLKHIGQLRSDANRDMYKAATEALIGVKDIKLLGRETVFLRRYALWSRRYSRYMATQQVVAQLPRYALESVAFGGLLVMVLVLLARESDLSRLLPVLGLYGFATYRLLPSLQAIFAAVASIRFSVPALQQVHAGLAEFRTRHVIDRRTLAPLPFRDRIEMRGVSFRYAAAAATILHDFDLAIAAGTTVAFVGPTGSGKTTTVDILLGLLFPAAGTLTVDGVVVDEATAPRWQMNIGYVPQQIFLADDTVTANIALGVRPREVDQAAVERAARLANIHDFIVQELPQGYATMIGERGVRLSGGQRQRLGIARALYDDPAVLVLDEATSALDGVTEDTIFDAVHHIGRSKTVVMIAHRLSTVRGADVIYLLDKGRILARGTYDELLSTCPEFRALAQVDRR